MKKPVANIKETMGAMTIMGMAASQARFLGLTARKSNVEYQGQQINQQRTALSNESANLYNQMMNLTVPTPPATSDFYKTTYVLEDSASSYAKSDYRITSMSKTYNAENEYKVTLSYDVEETSSKTENYKLGGVTKAAKTDNPASFIYTIPLCDTGAALNVNLTYDPENCNPYSTKEGDNGALDIEKNKIYKLDPNKTNQPDGYDECCTDKNTTYYFYQDKDNNCHFFTKNQLDEFIEEDENGKFKNINSRYELSTKYTYKKEQTKSVIATMEKSTNGRFSSISINSGDDVPTELSGRSFALTTQKEMDQNGYDDAYNDYKYNKDLYEKAISDINAQTEIIQNEDQQLELRLQQLNTEQNAISTEMDSVTKVIEDNVDKTFKVFA